MNHHFYFIFKKSIEFFMVYTHGFGKELLLKKIVFAHYRMIAVGKISFRKRRIILFRFYGTVITNVKINIKYL